VAQSVPRETKWNNDCADVFHVKQFAEMNR
jgi:hypothetical protein